LFFINEDEFFIDYKNKIINIILFILEKELEYYYTNFTMTYIQSIFLYEFLSDIKFDNTNPSEYMEKLKNNFDSQKNKDDKFIIFCCFVIYLIKTYNSLEKVEEKEEEKVENYLYDGEKYDLKRVELDPNIKRVKDIKGEICLLEGHQLQINEQDTTTYITPTPHKTIQHFTEILPFEKEVMIEKLRKYILSNLEPQQEEEKKKEGEEKVIEDFLQNLQLV
jgi:hypothetical protein